MSIDTHELWVVDELPERPTVVDVGANVGEFTAAVLERRPAATVFAFEANPALCAGLRERFAGQRVSVHGALGAERGELELHTHPDNPELGSFYLRPWVPEVQMCDHEHVEVSALDSFAIERVELLKIDAEGHEPEVIAGAAETLARTCVVLFEWISGASRYRESSELRRAVELLGHAGFEVRDAYGAVLDPSDDGPARHDICVARKRRELPDGSRPRSTCA